MTFRDTGSLALPEGWVINPLLSDTTAYGLQFGSESAGQLSNADIGALSATGQPLSVPLTRVVSPEWPSTELRSAPLAERGPAYAAHDLLTGHSADGALWNEADGVGLGHDESSRTLVIVDAGVDGYQRFVTHAKPGVEVVVLDGTRDGVEQITDLLAQRQGLTSLHIVSHGEAGRLRLGSTELSQDTLSAYADRLSQWAGALAVGADLLLYGCEVAAETEGETLLHALRQLTGADIAASTDLTGYASLGGDWDLETTLGAIAPELAFDHSWLQGYDAVLNTPIRIQAEDYKAGANGVTYFDTTAGNQGGAYRSGDVDLQVTTDVGGGFNVGWVRAGEWLTYDLNLAEAGDYAVAVRVASGVDTPKTLNVTIDGQTQTINFGGTGGVQSWQTVVAQGFTLSAGAHTLRLDALSEKFNINYIDIIPATADITAPTATLAASNQTLTAGSTSTEGVTFTVTYADNLGVDVSTVDSGDLQVTGPAGTLTATLVSVDPATDGTPRTATYQVAAPDGSWDSADGGTYTVAIAPGQVTDTNGNAVLAGTLGTFTVAVSTLPPPTSGPIRIQAEDYKAGANGVTYFDTTAGNQGGAYRSGDVDLQATTDVGGGFNVGWVRAGEWLTYDLTLAEAGDYAVAVRVASGVDTPKTLNVTIDGQTQTINFGGTGGVQAWQTVVAQGFTLSAGAHTLRLDALSEKFNINYIDIIPATADITAPTATLAASNQTLTAGSTEGVTFTVTYADNLGVDVSTLDQGDLQVTGPAGPLTATLVSVDPATDGTPRTATYQVAAPDGSWDSADGGTYAVAIAPGQVTDTNGSAVLAGTLGTFTVAVSTLPPPTSGPIRIQAEDYKAGANGVTYFDTTAGNQGGAYRSGDVDLQATTDVGGGFNVGWVRPGEWLTYDLNLADARFYDIVLRLASGDNTPKTLDFSIDGQTRTINLTGTGGAQVWQDFRLEDVYLTAGAKTLRIDFPTGFVNLNYIDLIPDEPAGHGGHPFLHVVIEAPDWVIDYDGNGSETLFLGGDESHTHEFGKVLTGWEWTSGSTVIGTAPNIEATLGLGSNPVSLTIQDSNSPPDTLTGSTLIDVFSLDAVGGVLAKYYAGGETPLSILIDNLPTAPDFIEILPSLTIQESNGLLGTSSFAGDVVAVLSGEFTPDTTGSYSFSMSGGVESDLYLNGLLVTAPITLNAGTEYTFEARVARTAAETAPIEILAAVNGGAAIALQPGTLTHDQSNFPPFVNKMPISGSELGGQTITLEGVGFFEGDAASMVKVLWGDRILTGPDIIVQQGKITLVTPPGTGVVPVRVETPSGISAPINFNYQAGEVPINFTTNIIAGTSGWSGGFGPTQGTWGPDGRLYVASLSGQIRAFTFNDNYEVVNTQVITTIQGVYNPNILGIAFNPLDSYDPSDPTDYPKIYVAHSLLFGNGGGDFPITELSPYSGQVSILSGPNFSQLTPLITGLPTSNHDHGINGLEFDANGDLLIAVGSNTGAGIPTANIGNVPESPFSAAILHADITDDDFTPNETFNGNIQYQLVTPPDYVFPDGLTFDPADSQAFGEYAKVLPGVDISVYASGTRNPFDIVWTTSGKLYGTDNGPGGGLYPASTGPDTQTTSNVAKALDELNLLLPGEYYGHPNRNRGQDDPRQNVYYNGDTATQSIPSVYTAPIANLLNSSVNGITEYRATTFGEQLRGNLLAQKWNGFLYSFKLSSDGTQVVTTDTLTGVSTGLDVVTGPGGVLLGIDYTDGYLTVSKPVDPSAVGVTAYDIYPWRAPAAGGNAFVIGGANFGDLSNTTVTIGGQTAILTSVTEKQIRGILPAFSTTANTLLDVVVTSGSQTSVIHDAFQPLGNRVPFTTGIGNVVVNANAPNTTVNLFDVFSDAEDADSALTYTVTTTSNPALFSSVVVNLATGQLVLDYAPDATGSSMLTVRATDSQGLFVEAPFEVTVLPNAGDTGAQAFVKFQSSVTNIVTSSSFQAGTFQITNTSTSGQRLNRVVIDLSSGILPDVVFDPVGGAGDSGGKDLTVDSGGSAVGYTGRTFVGPHDDGFDGMELFFNDFNPGETFTFSIDVDPTSIRGTLSPGPGEAGAISGLEMLGAQITAYFSDNTVLTGDTYQVPNSGVGSQVTLKPGLPVAPGISVVGLPSTPTTVSTANQTIRLTGPAGAQASLLLMEAGLFTAATGGFDIDPFEANRALSATEYIATIGAAGFVDIPITLKVSNPALTDLTAGSLNYIKAVLKAPDGSTGETSETLVLQLVP